MSLTFAFSRLKSAVAPVLFFFRKKLDFGMALPLSPHARSLADCLLLKRTGGSSNPFSSTPLLCPVVAPPVASRVIPIALHSRGHEGLHANASRIGSVRMYAFELSSTGIFCTLVLPNTQPVMFSEHR